MFKKFQKRYVLTAALLLAALILTAGFLLLWGRDADRRFEAYTQALFCQEVSSNTISLHYTLKEPAAYGIRETPISLGTCSTDTETVCAAAENALALLRSFDDGRLSGENRLTYDVLEEYLSGTLAESAFLLYEEPLAPLTGTQAQLPVLLSEYQFYELEDVEIYLDLLAQLPEYFQSILDFEKARSDEGLFMSDASAQAIADECQTFLDMEQEHYLLSSFEERLLALKLGEKQQNHYIQANDQAVETYVFPAYQTLRQGILELKGTGENSGGLCNFPQGQDYYEALAASETGSGRSIPELQKLTQRQIAEDLTGLQEVLASYINTETNEDSLSSDLFKTQGSMLEDSNPSSILTFLKDKLDGEFPAPPKVDFQVKYVQESMEEYLSPAFYMIPAIDNTQDNVIYINPGHLPDDVSLFTTLAHEGYPGHLYQTVYFASQDPDAIRSLLNFGGYTEGWATYTEMMSYYYAPLDHDQAVLMQKNASIMLGLYALADMGIHYDGWTLLDTVAFFRSYGITETDVIEEIYELIVGDPANYLKYYIGYVEFLELKKDAIQTWGEEFSQERFHKAVLEIGPAPFDVVREYMLGTEDF